MLQHGFCISQITVRNTVGHANRSHICNLPVSHAEQIVGQCIGSIKAVGNHGIQSDRIIIEIHAYNRDSGLGFYMFHIGFCHISQNNNTIYFFLLHEKRHLVFQDTVPGDAFQQCKASSRYSSFIYFLIHHEVKRIIFIQINFLYQDSDIILFFRRLPFRL